MSRIYDNWEKLVGAVLRREKDRQLALCESFSTSSSVDASCRFSFDSAIDDSSVEDVGADYFTSRFSFNPFAAGVPVPAGVDKQIDQAFSRTRDYAFQPQNNMKSVSRISGPRVDPAHLSSHHIFFFRNVMAIEYEEIMKATKKFSPDMLLGEGGFGRVYKGWIHEHNLSAVKPGSGLAVAVKKLNLEGSQGHKEWFNEINYLSQLRHSNLVRLVGYSFNKDDRIVVYEFMARGSLNNHLFRRGHQSLPWATRIGVAVGAARALAFLHGLEIRVVHRSMNSGDILLDGDFSPKLSDFGLARDGPTGSDTHVSTRVVGTYGYAAPEYIATGHLTTRCDVYGFGVILLELVTGLRVIDGERPEEKRNLLTWAVPYFKDKRRLSRIMDSGLEGQYPRREAYTVGKLALQCVNPDPKLRPNMSDVVVALEKL